MQHPTDAFEARGGAAAARTRRRAPSRARTALDAALAAATLFGSALAVAAAGFAVGEWRGWQLMRGPMEQALSRIVSAPVEIEGRFSLTLLPRPTLRAQVVRMASDSVGLPAAPFGDASPLQRLEARDVTVVLQWSDLWRWQTGDTDATLAVASVSATAMSARLQRPDGPPAGVGSVVYADGAGADDSDPGRAKPLLSPSVRVGRLDVDTLTLTYLDRRADTALLLTTVRAPGRPAIDGSDGVEGRLQGRLHGRAVDAAARADGGLPLWKDAEAPGRLPVAFHVDGHVGDNRLVFDGAAQAWLGASRLSGSLRLVGESLADGGAALGLALPSRSSFTANGTLAQRDGVWHYAAVDATLGRNVLGVELQYDARSPRPLLKGRVAGPQLAVANIDAGIGGSITLAAASARSTGGFALPGWRHLDVDLAVEVDAVDFGRNGDLSDAASATATAGRRAVPKPRLATRIRIDRGMLTLPEIGAESPGAPRAPALI